MANKIIYTRRIAMKLIEMGNVPIKMLPNATKPEFWTWIFPVTKKFEEDMAKLVLENENKNK